MQQSKCTKVNAFKFCATKCMHTIKYKLMNAHSWRHQSECDHVNAIQLMQPREFNQWMQPRESNQMNATKQMQPSSCTHMNAPKLM